MPKPSPTCCGRVWQARLISSGSGAAMPAERKEGAARHLRVPHRPVGHRRLRLGVMRDHACHGTFLWPMALPNLPAGQDRSLASRSKPRVSGLVPTAVTFTIPSQVPRVGARRQRLYPAVRTRPVARSGGAGGRPEIRGCEAIEGFLGDGPRAARTAPEAIIPAFTYVVPASRSSDHRLWCAYERDRSHVLVSPEWLQPLAADDG